MSLSLFIKSVLISIWLFILPTEPLITLVGLFIFGDTIMGLIASYVKKEPIISRKLFRLATKLFLYTAAILLIYGLDVLIISDVFGFESSKFIITKVAVGSLCVIEGFSIDEKIRKMNKNRGVKYYWNKIIKMVKSAKKDINDINEK